MSTQVHGIGCILMTLRTKVGLVLEISSLILCQLLNCMMKMRSYCVVGGVCCLWIIAIDGIQEDIDGNDNEEEKKVVKAMQNHHRIWKKSDSCGRHSAVYSTQVFALYFGQHLEVSQRVFGCNVCWMCCFAPVFCCVFCHLGSVVGE
eukprot:565409_1